MRCLPAFPEECKECNGTGVCLDCNGAGVIKLLGPKGEDLRPMVWSYAMDKKGRWEPANQKMAPTVEKCKTCGGVRHWDEFRGTASSVSPSVQRVPKDEHKGSGKCFTCKGTGQVTPTPWQWTPPPPSNPQLKTPLRTDAGMYQAGPLKWSPEKR